MLAYAFLAAHQQEKWQALLTRKIQDPSLSGDQKAHWLMAQAFFDEEFIAWAPELHWRNPPPFGAAMPWAQKALQSAQSSTMQVACLDFLVRRYAGFGNFAAAKAVIADTMKRLTDPAAQNQLAAWLPAISDAEQKQQQLDAAYAKATEIQQLQGEYDFIQRRINEAKKMGKSQEDILSLQRMADAAKAKLATSQQ